MNMKAMKPVMLSALAAVAFGTASVGATFALFTDTAETTVSVGAGKLDIDSSISGLHVYSAKADANGTLIDENNATYVYEEQTAVDPENSNKHYFVNGGWVIVSGATITLERLTPGDKIEFAFNMDGTGTNINYQYRVTYAVIDSTQQYALVSGLTTKIGSYSAEGLIRYESAWTPKAPGAAIDSVAFSIELPINKGNVYQEKTASIVISVEAVQGNASLSGPAAPVLVA